MRTVIGREFELAELIDRTDRAVAGNGNAIVIVGATGIGKSSLLDELEHLAHGKMRVLRATGVEGETDLSWSCLASLMRPLLATGDFDALQPARRRVLGASLYLHDDAACEPHDDVSGAPVDPYALMLALLDLVTHAAVKRPLLLLLDDMQWADPPSVKAVTYLARHLDNEFVSIIATARPTALDPSLPILSLKSLSHSAASLLLSDRSVSSASVREALIDAVGTNPLMLVNSIAELEPDVMRGGRPLPDPLPFSPTVLDGAKRRLDLLDDRTREALGAIAVLGRSGLREAHELLTLLGSDWSAIEDAERSQIVAIDDEVRFAHPTLRSAAYHTLSAPDRRRMHQHAAQISGLSQTTRAVHRAACCLGPDEAIAIELSEAADLLIHRGAWAVAAEYYARAAQLSTTNIDAEIRRLRAAELYLDLGLLEPARPLLDEIVTTASIAAVARTRARLLHLEERSDEGNTLLRRTAAELADERPTDAAQLLLECLVPFVRNGRLADVIEIVAELQVLRPRISGDTALRVDATASVFAMLQAPSGQGGLEAVDAVVSAEGFVHAAPFLAEVIAPALAFVRRDEALGALLDSIERALREQAAIVPLISVLAAQQLRHFGVRQPRAIEAGEEAIRLADEIGRPKLAMMAAVGLSISASAAGDAVTYGTAADLLATSTYPHAQASRLVGLATLHMSMGRPKQSIAVWETLADTYGFGDPLLAWEADYLETLTRLGRSDEAGILLAQFDAVGVSQRAPAQFMRVRAMITDDPHEASVAFQSAVNAFRMALNRVGEGRTELAWGEQLRRQRRRAEARAHLERALELFRIVGVPAWAARAENELMAAGALVDAALPVHALLTTQELRVARLVAGGASNREIGNELFLSERTIESHLTSILRKLQIKNRREIAARSVVDPALRPNAN